jgi:hypothetical protein
LQDRLLIHRQLLDLPLHRTVLLQLAEE